jgi:hypothetical protein
MVKLDPGLLNKNKNKQTTIHKTPPKNERNKQTKQLPVCELYQVTGCLRS